MWPEDQKLAAGDGGNSAIEDGRGHPRATRRKQHLARAETRPMRRGFIELDAIRLRNTEESIVGQVADADQLMRSVRTMTRRVGPTKRDAKLHVGNFQ
jgi:hypothetical protein